MSIIRPNSTSSMSISRNLGRTSFSWYLNGGEKTLVHKPADSNQSQNSSSSTTHIPFHLGKKKAEDTEIDVFTADKYFNEGTVDSPKTKELPNQKHKKKDPLQIFDIKEKTTTSPQSIHSESSGNSRSLLLHNIPRNQQPCRKSNKKSFLANIGCSCSGNEKNSVEIDDYKGDNYLNKSISSRVDNGKAKQELENRDVVASKEDLQGKKLDEIQVKLKTEDHISFPVFNPKTVNPAVEMELQEVEDNSMISLEVFGLPILQNGKNSLILEKKLTMLKWDTISPRVEEIEVPASSNRAYKDSDSDTSSDLFEIESLSKNANSFISRQESDGNSMSTCFTPTTCYAPSEASIEWSVITASGADLSTMSDTEERRPTITTAAATATIAYPQKTVLNLPKWHRPSILSGCKSHTAVRVAGDAFPIARRHHQPECFTPVTRFQAESKLTRFDKRNRKNTFDSSFLSRV
ncbi:Hypothetical predicted protein [Olea europaea subsp. europaea]|uniref:Protein PHYTOCHROME KINASE SUBSTRATE 1-like n=1 Tax=Olea europaea subsp. europaea TaxID=158383 RepID=A0A8S0PJJ1_OLEEU|nr:Hypothetical predicted protein [Olea europaea subsp. europaea]